MHVKHKNQHVYSLKYFTPENSVKTNMTVQNATATTMKDVSSEQPERVKSFLEPDENAFIQIRKRLSTLTLSTAYKKGLEYPVPPPMFNDRKYPPRRISSISSRDTSERYKEFQPFQRKRTSSRTSFLSDDREFRHERQPMNYHNTRASETAALNKLSKNILTPRQNPELFSRQIRLNNKMDYTSRSTSPKSMKSMDSTGKMHLGLIESLDLNEKLNDVEKIKERYSNDHFMTSLSLYKLRGHDRCFHPEIGQSGHIARGTRLQSPPDQSRSDSTMSDNMNTLGNVISPRMFTNMKYTSAFNDTPEWEPNKSHVFSQVGAKSKFKKTNKTKTQPKRKKSVGFNMVPMELTDDESSASPTLSRERSKLDSSRSSKEPKSILKRSADSESSHTNSIRSQNLLAENQDDEFLANANYRWRFQLPKVHSPVGFSKTRKPLPFRKKMYHFGDGVSNEFEQVISNYGNCRQSSVVRDTSFARESSQVT